MILSPYVKYIILYSPILWELGDSVSQSCVREAMYMTWKDMNEIIKLSYSTVSMRKCFPFSLYSQVVK